MRHVSRTHRVALDWLFDGINLDPKIQIKYIDTKNPLADILTKGNFTRDEWNHLLCLFNTSHFSSTVCSETIAKRLQQDSGEERVTAKSRPMMSLSKGAVERIVLDFSKPGEDLGDPTSAMTERNLSTTIIMSTLWKVSLQQATQKWDDDHAWSSREWKTDLETYERPGRPGERDFLGKCVARASSFDHRQCQDP